MMDKEARGIIAEGSPLELKEHSIDPRVRSFFLRQKPEENGEKRFYAR
jgi:phospholipid/cholesterol/gamma-HCH transport system ATP-binding protein